MHWSSLIIHWIRFSSCLFLILILEHGHSFVQIPIQRIVSFQTYISIEISLSLSLSLVRLDYPPARKFHSIFPFRPNQAIIFGGTNFRRTLNLRSRIDSHLWIFDFEKLTWSRLPLLTMLQPTYFHAAAMNEVRIRFMMGLFFSLIDHRIFLFSGVKSGHTEVLYIIQRRQILKNELLMSTRWIRKCWNWLNYVGTYFYNVFPIELVLFDNHNWCKNYVSHCHLRNECIEIEICLFFSFFIKWICIVERQ